MFDEITNEIKNKLSKLNAKFDYTVDGLILNGDWNDEYNNNW